MALPTPATEMPVTRKDAAARDKASNAPLGTEANMAAA